MDLVRCIHCSSVIDRDEDEYVTLREQAIREPEMPLEGLESITPEDIGLTRLYVHRACHDRGPQ